MLQRVELKREPHIDVLTQVGGRRRKKDGAGDDRIEEGDGEQRADLG
jgi:hypothetical protein